MSLIFSRKKGKEGKLARKFVASRRAEKEYSRLASIVFSIVVLSLSIFLVSGGLYVWLENPPSVVYPSGVPVFYIQGLSIQTSSETVFSIVFTFIGLLGGLLAYRSSSSTRNRRAANILLIVAIIMLAMAVLGVQLLLEFKL